MLEDVNVAGSCVTVAMDGVSLIDRSHEGQELAGDNPVKITVLHLFVVFVFPRIESLKVVPSEPYRVLQPLQAMQDGALVLARAPTRIPIRVQVGLVLLEQFEGRVGVHFQDDDHEGAHEVGRVGQLGELSRSCVVVNARRTLEALRLEELLQLAAEAVRHRKVQRAEVLVERHIGQILRSQKVANVLKTCSRKITM